MTPAQAASNPFALMMNPEEVLEAVARSERLASLKSQVWRPLDKPLVARAAEDATVYDELIEDAETLDLVAETNPHEA